jgi:hypothetical protein
MTIPGQYTNLPIREYFQDGLNTHLEQAWKKNSYQSPYTIATVQKAKNMYYLLLINKLSGLVHKHHSGQDRTQYIKDIQSQLLLYIPSSWTYWGKKI